MIVQLLLPIYWLLFFCVVVPTAILKKVLPFVGAPVEALVLSIGKSVFNLRPVLIDDAEHWACQGPTKDSLPAVLLSALFFRGNPAADAVGDPTWAEFDSDKRTLVMVLAGKGTWSWNDDIDGFAGFFLAWLIGMKYTFFFDEKYERATIHGTFSFGGLHHYHPIFADTITWTSFSGGTFYMHRKPDEQLNWVRESLYKSGGKMFDDYFPTGICTHKQGEGRAKANTKEMATALASLKDHPTFDSKAVSGGATRSQLLAWD